MFVPFAVRSNLMWAQVQVVLVRSITAEAAATCSSLLWSGVACCSSALYDKTRRRASAGTAAERETRWSLVKYEEKKTRRYDELRLTTPVRNTKALTTRCTWSDLKRAIRFSETPTCSYVASAVTASER